MSQGTALRALFLSFALLVAGAAAQAAPPGQAGPDAAASWAAKEPLDALVKEVEHAHPAAMFILAHRLFDAGRRDEAVFWFYEGQLRWRALMMNTNPDGHPIFNGEQDHFDVLFSDVGPDINKYAFEDTAKLLKTADAVLAWDAAHPDDLTPNGNAKDAARAGLVKLKDYIVSHRDEIAQKVDERKKRESANASPDDPYSGEGGALFGTPASMVPPYDPQAFAPFRVGATTKAQVVQALGKPEMWYSDSDGSSTISYSFHKSSPGMAMIGMSQRVIVSFKFDPKRILVSISLPKDP